MKKIVIIFICISFLSVTGQQQSSLANKDKVLSLMNQAQKKYETLAYFEMNADFILYKNYSSSLIAEKYSGFFIKNGNQNYSKIDQVESLQTGNKSVKIFHKNKIIEYRQTDTNLVLKDIFVLSNEYLNYFSEFELEESSTIWRCILKTGAVSMVPYSKVIVEIDKQSGTFLKQELFFLITNQYIDQSGNKISDYPRLEIRYSNFNTEKRSLSSVFNIKQYIIEHKGRYSLPQHYKEYKLIDLSTNL